jgi:beta-N-acetylhexosaminidase
MTVGGCAMSSTGVNAMHACLSDQVVESLLRGNMGFDGVVISECLELELLSRNIGVQGGTVMAVDAGCDQIIVCRSYTGQQEAFNGLKLGLENGLITEWRLRQSLRRMLELQARCTS